MIYIKTEEEIELMRIANDMVAQTLGEMAKVVAPGVSTLQLDKIAHDFICDNKGRPSFLGYNGFPGSICASVNEQVVHGFPSEYQLRDGDIISVDVGVEINGFNGDSAYTFTVGDVAPATLALLQRTKESLYKGIEVAVDGARIGDVGATIQRYNEAAGYSVVRELVGHGVGRHLHEEPEVPNYGKPGRGVLLKSGMCIAIEPMINLGTKNIVVEKDQWTIRTRDRKPSAHFEHTIVVRKGVSQILSSFDYIDQVLNNK